MNRNLIALVLFLGSIGFPLHLAWAQAEGSAVTIEAIITGAHMLIMRNPVYLAYHTKGSTGLIDDKKFAEIIRWVYLDVKDQPNKTFRMRLELATRVGLAKVSESEKATHIQLAENLPGRKAKLSCRNRSNRDKANIYEVMSLEWVPTK